jgi:hypothetical protein
MSREIVLILAAMAAVAVFTFFAMSGTGQARPRPAIARAPRRRIPRELTAAAAADRWYDEA